MIPKIIHRTWKTNDIPFDVFPKNWVDSWKLKHPSWEFILWTDSDIDEFIKSKFTWFYDRFLEYPHNIQRIDVFRYFVLYKYGGVYVDMDFECFKSFDPIVNDGYNLVLSREHDHLKDSKSLLYRSVANSFMMSAQKHPFWEHVFNVLQSKIELNDVLTTTGPMMLTQAMESAPDDSRDGLFLMPSNWVFPYTWKHYKGISGRRKVARVLKDAAKTSAADWPDSYAAHKWTEVWK